MGEVSGERCRKVGYRSRKTARRALRRLHPNDQLRAYRCEHCGYWHGGHNPPEVTAGLVTAFEYYTRWVRPTHREVSNP